MQGSGGSTCSAIVHMYYTNQWVQFVSHYPGSCEEYGIAIINRRYARYISTASICNEYQKLSLAETLPAVLLKSKPL